MAIHPIIERELRMALRRKHPLKTRLILAAGTGFLTFEYLMLSSGSRNPAKIGKDLFEILYQISCLLVVVGTLRLTADLFAIERRNNTLGLLFLTGMSPGEVFLSKVFGGAWMALCNLFSVLPCLVIAMLVGGVSTSSVLGAAISLPMLLGWVLSLSLLGSAWCDDESVAMVVAVAVGLATSFGTPAICMLGQTLLGSAGPALDWRVFSPACGPWLVIKTFGGGSLADVTVNGVCTAVCSWVTLAVAAWRLGSSWREPPSSDVSHGWRRIGHVFVHGSVAWRRRLRKRWLDAGPFVWLALRDRRPRLAAWASVGLIIAVWLVGWILWRDQWPGVPNFLLTTVVVYATVGGISVYSAAKRLGEDRRSGALELLLTSPLSVAEIVEGQKRAVWRQLKPVYQWVGVLTLFFFSPDWRFDHGITQPWWFTF